MVTNAIDPGGYYPNKLPGQSTAAPDAYATAPGVPSAPTSSTGATSATGGTNFYGLAGNAAPSSLIGTGFYAQEGGAIDTGDDSDSQSAPDTVPSSVDAVRGALGYDPVSSQSDDNLTTGGIVDDLTNWMKSPYGAVGSQLGGQQADDSSDQGGGKPGAPGAPAAAPQERSTLGNAIALGQWGADNLVSGLTGVPYHRWQFGNEAGGPVDGYAAGGSVAPRKPRNIAPVLSLVERALDHGRRKHGLVQQPQQPMARGFQEGGSADDEETGAISVPADQGDQTDVAAGKPAPDQSPPLQPPYDQTLPRNTVIGEQAGLDETITPQEYANRLAQRWQTNKVMDYLQGAGAATQQQREAAESKVDPEGEMDPGHRTTAAVAATSAENPDAAFSLTQSYRQMFEHSKHFAAAATDAGDMPAAAQAANLAFQKVPDGNTYNFTPTDNGVTMSVTDQFGRQSSADLTPQQLSALLKSPKTMFDALAGAAPPPAINQPGGAPQQTPPGLQFPEDAPGVHGALSRTPGGQPWLTSQADAQAAGLPQGRTPNYAAEAKARGVDESVVRTSHEMFPTVGQNKARLQYIDQQKQQGEQNKIAQTKLADLLTQAQLRLQGTKYTADQKRQTALEVRDLMGRQALANAAQRGEDAMRREVVGLIGKDAMLSRTNGGRLAVSLANQGKSIDDINAALKQSGSSIQSVYGDDAIKKSGLANYLQQVGTQPILGAAPTTVSTQIPGTPPPGAKQDQNGQWWVQGPNDTAVRWQPGQQQ